MSRAELLLPDGWRPARNMRVRILPHPDEPQPPAGVWRLLDRSNGFPGPHWWAMPHDDAAHWWVEQHPSRIVSGCLEVKGLRCAPPAVQLEIPGSRGGRR